ncbi:MAG: serine hydrolase domain-containing protein [Christensenellales bacterium]|nr:serine hydrolase domain-containing protein [Christensenellales bacterium]
MLKTLEERIRRLDYRLYEVALVSDEGVEFLRLQPGNLCQNCYSVAKAFTVTAVGMACDGGKLRPSDRVADILGPRMEKAVDPRWKEVTVDHVLCHRIGYGRGLLDIDADDASAYPTRDYLAIALGAPLEYAPGTHYQYTDAAFYIASRLVARATGETVDRLLQTPMFSVMDFREAAWSRCPQGYPIGATGLYITARDMVKLGWLYVNEGRYGQTRILSRDWVCTVLNRGYEFHPMGDGWYGKGGMNGQMLMFHPRRRLAAAWHAFEPGGTPDLTALMRSL